MAPRSALLLRRAAVLAGGLALLAVPGFFAAQWALGRYIESEAFRHLASVHTGAGLGVEAEYAPFHLAGSELYSEGLQAHGAPGAPLASLQVRQLHAQWSLAKLWDRVCELPSVEAESLSVRWGETRPAPALPPPGAPPPPSARGGWLASLAPNRLEVRRAEIRQVDLAWSGGQVRGLHAQATAEGATGPEAVWKITGAGGALEAGGWPALEVRSLRLRYRAPTLFVESAELAQGEAGTASVEGEVRFGEDLDLRLAWDRLPLDALLSPDWRQHVHGTLRGEAQVRSRLPAARPPEIRGTWSVAGGRLEGLPILNDLALFTGSAQFRQAPLSQAKGRFRQAGPRLELTELVAESNGLARLEGALTFENEQVEGNLQFGLNPQLLQWLPGARGRVFASQRDGYAWAPVHLSGPVKSPREDLSARLAAATAGEVLDTAGQAASQVREKAQEAAKGVLDLIFGK